MGHRLTVKRQNTDKETLEPKGSQKVYSWKDDVHWQKMYIKNVPYIWATGQNTKGKARPMDVHS